MIVASTDVHAALRYRRRTRRIDEHLRRGGDVMRALGGSAFMGTVAASMPLPGGAYSPVNESGDVLWVDPHDASTYTLSGGGTGNVTACSNKVSAAALTIASDPAYNATGINGAKCFTCDSNDWLTDTESAVYNAANGTAATIAFTVFFVAVTTATTAFKLLGGWGINGSANSRIVIGQSSTGGWCAINDANDVGAVTLESGVANDGAAHVHEFIASASTLSYLLDGTPLTLTGGGAYSGTYTPSEFAIGRSPQGTTLAWAGSIGDCLVYAGVLDSAARGRVRAYLGTKYSITVVP